MRSVLYFFFNDTATTEIYTLSLHDALPICVRVDGLPRRRRRARPSPRRAGAARARAVRSPSLSTPRAARGVDNDGDRTRSEEHTSELQSQSNIVCRLLLAKKKSLTECYITR